ADRCIKKWG
ncbi:cytochrome c551 peroxidase, partial [Vibrio parahaemolyticus V-223/04]